MSETEMHDFRVTQIFTTDEVVSKSLLHCNIIRKEHVRTQLDRYSSQGEVNRLSHNTIQIIELKIHTGSHTSLSTDSLFIF